MLLPEFSFEFILTSGDYIFGKPHPQIFKMALHKTGLEAERVWSGSVEITYGAIYKGVMIWACVRSGIRFVWIRITACRRMSPMRKS